MNKPVKILIVDDEFGMRESCLQILDMQNIENMAVDNGEQALSMIKDDSFDIVITDMMLPGISGMDLLRRFIPRNVVLTENFYLPKL